MAVRATPLWIAAGCYTDTDLRAYFSMLDEAPAAGGVRAQSGSEMVVSAPGGMNVAVAPGTAWVPGSDAAGQGSYLVDNPTSTTVAISAANPTNPRIDRIVADVNDPAFTGSGTPVFSIVVVAGTPAGSPVAPAVPPSAIPLARVAVAAAAVAITAGNITDERTFAVHGGEMLTYARATGPQGPLTAETDLTGLTVSPFCRPGRIYEAHVHVYGSGATGTQTVTILVKTGTSGVGTALSPDPVQAAWEATPAGFHAFDLWGYFTVTAVAAYPVHARMSVNTSTFTTSTNAGNFITVRDIGAA